MNIFYLAADPRMRLNDQAGYATHIRNTMDAFKNSGHNVTKVIGGEVGNFETKKKLYKGLKRKIPYSCARLLSEIHEIIHDRMLFKYCSNVFSELNKVSFIYERISPFHLTGLRLSEKFRIPLILEVNDPFDELLKFYPFVLKPYLLRTENKLLRESHGIIVGSRRLKDYLVRKKIDNSRIRVVYPTADYKIFNPELTANLMGRELFMRGSSVIGYIGSMRPWHRIDILLDAMGQIVKDLKGPNLLIVGGGPEKEKLIEITNKLRIDNYVKFAGSVDYRMIPSYIKIMDICVIPHATWYGSPTKLFEYGAMAKPVVGPRDTPVDEIIEDDCSGCLVEPGNSEQLSSNIIKLVRNMDIAHKFGINLRAKLTKEITWDKNVEIICSLV